MPDRSALTRPNVLIVLADDLGYSDLGSYGSEIRTPNIDALAAEGLRFSDYHTSPLCSPTRAMLMSGTDCHLAGLGVMSENPSLSSEYAGRRGFEGYLNRDVVTIPELLQEAGYQTFMSGKWHLGYLRDQIPCDRGFDRSLSLLVGSHNHFGWHPDWRAESLPKAPGGLGGNEPIYVKNDRRWLPQANVSEDPAGFFSSHFFADTLIEFLRDSHACRTAANQPFFAYLPFTAPHTPMQCFKTDRDHYTGVYDDGPDALRVRRLAGMKNLEIVPRDVVPHDVFSEQPSWVDLPKGQQKLQSRTYECYSGMVEALDRATGRVIDHLRESGELDNTLVMIFSDNGPASGTLGGEHSHAAEMRDMLGARPQQTIQASYNNRYENLGAYDSHPRPNARWAQASTAPHRLFKGMPTEGGVRVPMIVRYPPFMKHHHPGGITHAFATVMDIMPTILSLAGVTHPNAKPASPTTKAPWRGWEVYPSRGRDWSPWLLRGQADTTEEASGDEAARLSRETERLIGRKQLFTVSNEGEAIWGGTSPAVGWEMHGRAAIRKGRWKILNLDSAYGGTNEWELFDLVTDQGETTDVAKIRPEKLEEMLGYWKQYQQETGAYLRREHPEWRQPIKEEGCLLPGQMAWLKVPLGETLPPS